MRRSVSVQTGVGSVTVVVVVCIRKVGFHAKAQSLKAKAQRKTLRLCVNLAALRETV